VPEPKAFSASNDVLDMEPFSIPTGLTVTDRQTDK